MADYEINILADLSAATKEVSTFTKSIDKQFSAVTNTVGNFKNAIVASALALGAGFSLKKAIDEAVRAEDALNSFNIVLKQTGIFTEKTSESFVKFADELEKSTSISSESILDLSSKIQLLTGLGAADLARLTKATIDFAKNYGVDLETAGNLAAKAINGQTIGLKKLGITLNDTGTQAGNLNSVLKVFEQSQGVAAERALTFSGRVAQLHIQFGNLLEEIGNLIIKNPIILKSFDELLKVFDELKDLVKQNEQSFARFVTFIGSGAVTVFKLLSEAVLGAVDIFDILKLGVLKAEEILIEFVIAYRKFTALFSRGDSSLSETLKKDLKNLEEVKKRILDVKIGLAAETINKGQVVKVEKETKVTFDTKKGRGALGEEKGETPEQRKNRLKQEQIGSVNSSIAAAGAFLSAIKNGASGVAQAFGTAIKLFLEKSTVFKNLLGDIGNKLAPQISKLIGGFAQFAPAIGGVAAQLFEFLAQGPEAVKAQIQAFVDNIPVIIDAIVEAIPVVVPVFIQALADNSGPIITALSAAMPRVANSLAISLITEAPNIAKSFVNSLIAEAGRLIQSIADGVKSAISGAIGGGGGLGGILKGGLIGGAVAGPVGAITSIAKKFKFAEGGVVPGGFPNDTFPAQLTSGEGIVPNDTMRRLDQFISSQGIGRGGGTTVVKLVIGEQELASVILGLNQRGFRTS